MMHAYADDPSPEWQPSMIPDGIQLDYAAYPNDMRNMGGLWKRIPLTALSFLIGGLSLAGFPLITAGFWSKDEIFADAFTVGTSDGIYWLHLVVFFSLFLAACFTAFYTGRQWLLTFWGEPRSEAAKHATLMKGHYVDEHALDEKGVGPMGRWFSIMNDDEVVDDSLKGKPGWYRLMRVFEDSAPMQAPLLFLAIFALVAGWVGIPADFPIVGGVFNANLFKDFIKYTILETPEAPKFNLIPVAASFIASLGGLALAWWIYGVRPVQKDEKDPVQTAVGDGLWGSLQMRFNLDNAYLRLLYVPFERFGREVTYKMIDQETINSLMADVANLFVNLGEVIKRFNYVVIDGVGDGIPAAVGAFSRWFRGMQTGRAQQYMLFAAIALLAMGSLLIAQSLF
jgi:NADH-quinone oxidoreductase subunit L